MLLDIPDELVWHTLLAYQLANTRGATNNDLEYSAMLEKLVAEKVLEFIRKKVCNL